MPKSKNLIKKVGGVIPIRSQRILDIQSNKKLSSGEKALLDFYSSIFNYLSRFGEHQYSKNVIVLLDEADLGFHPEWKKRFVSAILNTLPLLLKSNSIIENIQIIITTHDPFTISDIPNSNIIYLKKDGDKTIIVDKGKKSQKSFGANITDLLADSFFIGDGLIGDFAKEKINDVINFINGKDSNIKTKEAAKQIIEIIDEPYLKSKLLEMYYELYSKDYDIDKEKEQIRKRAIELGIIKE